MTPNPRFLAPQFRRWIMTRSGGGGVVKIKRKCPSPAGRANDCAIQVCWSADLGRTGADDKRASRNGPGVVGFVRKRNESGRRDWSSAAAGALEFTLGQGGWLEINRVEPLFWLVRNGGIFKTATALSHARCPESYDLFRFGCLQLSPLT